jgi:hypothetical protein
MCCEVGFIGGLEIVGREAERATLDELLKACDTEGGERSYYGERLVWGSPPCSATQQ